MTAIVWKELRENLKWAVLCTIALTIGMTFAAIDGWDSLCSGSFIAFTLCATCAGGFLLGLGQVVPERARDQWAFLMHRPLSPTRIFLSKVIAGLGLYLAAMLISLFLAAFWVSRPGRIPAPFDWRMTQAGVVLILNGTLCYFSGLIIGTRRARWYASAILPLSIAVFSTFNIFWVVELWQALSLIFIGVAIVVPAAWGSFTCGGQHRSQPLVARAALGLTIICGFVMLSSVLEMALAYWGKAYEHKPSSWSFYHTFGSEAQIVRVAYNSETRSQTVTDLEGKPATVGGNVPMHTLRGWNFNEPYYFAGRVFSADRYVRLIHSGGPGDEHVQWYYSCREGLLLGYDTVKRELVGSIGPEGFVPAGQQPKERFADAPLDGSLSGSNCDLLALPTGLYRVNLAPRRLQPVFSAVPGEPITCAVRLSESWQTPYERYSLAVISGNRVRVLDPEGRQLFSFDLQWPDYPWVYATRVPGGERYVIWYRWFGRQHGPERVVELASDGRELRRYDLPPLPEPVSKLRWRRPILLIGLNASRPLARSVIWVPMGYLLVREPYERLELWGWLKSFVRGVLYPNPFMTPMLVSGAFCAVGIWLLARRRGFEPRDRRVWTAVGFLAGPVGILTLLVLRDRPVRVPCPACGKPRVVNREHCEHCSAAFTRPARDPADIFDDTPAERCVPAAG